MEGTPPARRRRLLDAGGPIEDDESARRLMRNAEVYYNDGSEYMSSRSGFDPDDVMDVKEDAPWDFVLMTPMTYYAEEGYLPMMRWLYINGAGVTGHNDEETNPMRAAALNGHKEAVKWLFLHGAASDLVGEAFSYLFVPYRGNQNFTTCTWLILKGAFCRDDDEDESGLPVLDVEKMKASLGQRHRCRRHHWTNFTVVREALRGWAIERHEVRTSFLTFLNGTASRPAGKVSPYLVSLNGKSGILELIADYSGPPLGREALIIRQLVELLPDVISELNGEEYDVWLNTRKQKCTCNDHHWRRRTLRGWRQRTL